VAGHVVEIVQAASTFTYYFAEGATSPAFFATRIALLNTDATSAANVTIEFLPSTGATLTHSLVLGPQQRTTLDVGALAAAQPSLAPLASAAFSTVVTADRPIVADRTMTWDPSGYGSHAERAIDAPASEWFLAEGATIGDFELYYLIENPNPDPLDDEIEVTYLLPPPALPIVRTYSVGGRARRTIAVHLEPGLQDAEVSAIVRTPAGRPVIVERAMYLTTGGLFYGAGHAAAGLRAPGRHWHFAEGATGPFFDLFVLVANPNPVSVRVTATLLFDDGTTCSTAVGDSIENGQAVISPNSRYNILVDALTLPGCPRNPADAALATTLDADLPVVAERAMWWPGPTAATWAEAHATAGAPEAGTLWALAEGEQGGASGLETYLLVSNTSAHDGTARATLYFEDGTTTVKDVPLPATSRTNIAVGAPEALGGFGSLAAGRRFGVTIESLPVPGQPGPARIVVERAMYATGPGAVFWGAGTAALATRIR
jgi:hypothetical protein